MPIDLNSTLSSSVANATFMDQTVNTQTVGQLSLNNTDSASGSSVSNTQREINKSTKIVNAAEIVDAAGQLTLDELSMNQVFRVTGNGAPITLNALLFSNQPIDGCEIIIIGQDDTNTVTISFNDSQYGQYINGSATLKRGYLLRLIYDAGLERFIEVGRNF